MSRITKSFETMLHKYVIPVIFTPSLPNREIYMERRYFMIFARITPAVMRITALT
jgi:hypothetical protein